MNRISTFSVQWQVNVYAPRKPFYQPNLRAGCLSLKILSACTKVFLVALFLQCILGIILSHAGYARERVDTFQINKTVSIPLTDENGSDDIDLDLPWGLRANSTESELLFFDFAKSSVFTLSTKDGRVQPLPLPEKMWSSVHSELARNPGLVREGTSLVDSLTLENLFKGPSGPFMKTQVAGASYASDSHIVVLAFVPYADITIKPGVSELDTTVSLKKMPTLFHFKTAHNSGKYEYVGYRVLNTKSIEEQNLYVNSVPMSNTDFFVHKGSAFVGVIGSSRPAPGTKRPLVLEVNMQTGEFKRTYGSVEQDRAIPYRSSGYLTFVGGKACTMSSGTVAIDQEDGRRLPLCSYSSINAPLDSARREWLRLSASDNQPGRDYSRVQFRLDSLYQAFMMKNGVWIEHMATIDEENLSVLVVPMDQSSLAGFARHLVKTGIDGRCKTRTIVPPSARGSNVFAVSPITMTGKFYLWLSRMTYMSC